MYFDKDNSKCVCFLKNPIDGNFIVIFFVFFKINPNVFFLFNFTDVDKRMMHKEAKTLGLILDIVTPTITKRNVESATEINLKEAPAKEISMGSILQAPPLILLKKEISPERTAEIIKGFETVKIELNHLINQLKLGKMDKKTLQQETEVLRRKLRRIVADNDMLQAIEDIKEKHMQLKSRLQPIKRSVNIKNFEPLRRSIIFK